MSAKIVCCGLLVADLKFSTDEFPKEDEKVFAHSFDFLPGGPATNAALTIQQLGLPTKLLTSTGNCALSSTLLKTLSDNGIDTTGVSQQNHALNVAAIFSEKSGDRRAISFKAQHSSLIPEGLKEPSIILVDGHQPETSLALLREFPKVPSILDAGSVHEGTELLAGKVNWLITSQKYARHKTGENDLEKALLKLSHINSNTVITTGENGCHYFIQGEIGHIPGIDVNCIDSNGAGDVFHGAFGYALAQEMNYLDGLKFANNIAARSCEQKGIIGSVTLP